MKILDQLKALLHAGTFPDWRAIRDQGHHVVGPEGEKGAEVQIACCETGEDTNLIAAMHNALPALIAVAEAAGAYRDQCVQFPQDRMAVNCAHTTLMSALDALAETELGVG